MTNSVKLSLAASTVFLTLASSFSQITFPYTVPANPTAELDVNTSVREPIEPMNLSLNYGPRSYYGFNSAGDKAQVRSFDPPSTRWPIGVWANWYNWETDGWETDDTYDGEFDHIIVNNPNKRYGFPGLTELHDEMNFDILWSWNVNYDSPAKGVNRLNDRFEKGYDFEWLELGNEIFWKGQRSWATETATKYVGVAQSHSTALKAEDPYIQLAVPATWRETTTTSGWNGVLDNDQSYYDAITVHKYIRHTDASETVANIKEVMKAGVVLKDTSDDMAALFPGKPQWYSEWGVTCGSNALSVIGMNDMFLTFFRDQSVFAMNQYHQVNGMDEFLTDTDDKTAYGAAYDVLRAVFENSELYEGAETATLLDPDTPVVQSAAVNKDGEIIVYAHNKTPNSIPFTLKLDGTTYTGNADHHAYIFSSLNAFPQFTIEEDPLTVVALQTASIVLPPYSMSVISGLNFNESVSSEILIEAESADGQADFSPYETRLELGGHTYITMTNGASTVNYNIVNEPLKGWATYDFQLLEAGDVSIEAMGKFETSGADSFWHRLDGGTWIKHDGLVGGGWKWVTLTNDQPLAVGSHTLQIARREALTKLDGFRLTSSNATLADPRTTAVPNIGTTRIEAEDYDEGGEGVGYHDRTPGNDGAVYRNDNVDLQVCIDIGGGYQVHAEQVGEWLQYPINVEAAGSYELKIRAARSDAGDSTFRVLFNDENATGTLQIQSTGSLDSWTDVITTVQLEVGKQMMQLKLTGGDVAVNYIELTPYIVPAPWVQTDVGAVGADGVSSYSAGTFTLNASGSDIWNTADEFHFVYRPMIGDCEIMARVASIENTNPWAKAGVMIRETLDANSVNVAMLLSAGNGVQMQTRTATGDATSSVNTPGVSAPRWMKLTRSGDTFNSYRSVDGVNWIPVGSSQTVPMVGTVYVGLAATSHLDGTLGTSTFDNVEMLFALSAYAGVDQVMQDSDADGVEVVSLDATGSMPSDEYPIADYTWSRGSMPLATGLYANVTLPLGTHLLTLQVIDSNGATSSDIASITVEPGTASGGTSLLAGWETWNNSATSPATLTDGVTASGANDGFNINADGSTDGTWGTWASPTADQTTDLSNDSAFLGNGAEGFYDFTLTDTTGEATDLAGFHFDSATFRPNSSRDYELSVLAGDLSLGSVASGNIPSATGGVQDWSDVDIDLTGLADHELDANGSVTFRLAFTGGTLGAGGHHQYLDNVGITSLSVGEDYAYPDADGNGLPDWWENFYFGSTGQVAGVDSDLDGLSNADELTAGSDPGDIDSSFVVHDFVAEAGGYTVKWDSYSDRTYNVMKGVSLTSNDWMFASGNLPGTGGEMSFFDPSAVGTNVFYKIQVSQP